MLFSRARANTPERVVPTGTLKDLRPRTSGPAHTTRGVCLTVSRWMNSRGASRNTEC